MGTVSGLIDSARYDLIDYETGIVFDDAELLEYLNRMIVVMDSQFAALNSTFVHGIEEGIDTVASQDYIDISTMNRGYWDSIRSVWIGDDRLTGLPLDLMYYERKFRSGDAYPNYWSLEGDRILFETSCDDAHTDVTIHYNKKHRPRLNSWSDTFTGEADDDYITLASGAPTFVTGDGIFTLTEDNTLPTGLAESTNYWCILDPDSPTKLRLATSRVKAMSEKQYEEGYILIEDATYRILARTTLDFTDYGAAANTAGTYFTCDEADGELGEDDIVLKTESVNLTGDGVSTNTITLSDYMPYDGRMDDFLREMMVMYAKGKREGNVGTPDQMYQSVFRKRAMEETLRREKYMKEYHMNW